MFGYEMLKIILSLDTKNLAAENNELLKKIANLSLVDGMEGKIEDMYSYISHKSSLNMI